MRDTTTPTTLNASGGTLTAKAGVEKMTMDQWKRIHHDFKASHIGPDGKRWRAVLRPGGLIHVEIVKE